MPDLLSRAITLQPFRQFAVFSQNVTRLHIRRSHGTAAAQDRSLPVDSLNHSQTTVDNDGPPLKLRKHGFKSLPLSPLMRTETAPATTRRAPVDEALKEFQKGVAMNPFAQALATPARYCSLTLAHLPSHFLLPFATVIDQTPAPDTRQPPQVKVRFQPGRNSDHPSLETLAQTSYIINRQDAVRQLSRKRHWTNLVLERQRTKVAGIARRSSSSQVQKLVQDLWVWENQVDAMGAYLERKVVAEAMRALRTAKGVERDAASEEQVPGLKFIAVGSEGVATSSPGEANTTMYDLATLLSSEALDHIAKHAAQDVTEGVWKLQGSHALRIRLAIERLKRYKETNEIQKALPMVQNPAGSREARLSKLGSRSEEGKEES